MSLRLSNISSTKTPEIPGFHDMPPVSAVPCSETTLQPLNSIAVGNNRNRYFFPPAAVGWRVMTPLRDEPRLPAERSPIEPCVGLKGTKVV